MALEPITRQEQIIAGKELKPITRMEKFLKEYGGGTSSWNDLKDKPFGEVETVVNEPLNITWDGNTEGLVSVGNMFFKVSDAVLTDEQIASVTLVNSLGTSFVLAKGELEALENTTDIVLYDGIAFVRKENVTAMGRFTFTETGVYLMFFGAGQIYTTSLTTTEPVELTKTVVEPLDEKYMPILTSPGGKKFKLSVDDNGTITATEVT